ncbi:MAG: hypothetical protein HDT37_00060 [Clostridiales bacterium]|nr:hypothetical protein [Clostridiales bacterium]
MTKLFRYELRRVLRGKLFFMVLLVCLGLGWLTLTTVTIRGTAHTAPFSPWSFGDYLSRLLPLLCLGELCLVSVFTSRRERAVQMLTQTAPIDPGRYALIRWGAVLTGTLALWLCVIALAVGFYVSLFGWQDYGALAAPALLTLLPAGLLCLGAGWTLGRRHPTLLYAVMGAALLLCWLPLPQELSFSMGGFFARYPLGLDRLDPAFSVPAALAAARCLWFAAGAALLFHQLFRARK